MKNSRVHVSALVLLDIILVLMLAAGQSAWANSLSECTSNTCTWNISVDGTDVMSGMYMADADGNIILSNPVDIVGDGYTVSLDMNGNIDPLLGFGLGATNTSGALKTFAFAFSLPLGGLTVPIATASDLGTSLTAFTSAGGSVFPTLGIGKIVDSQDIVLSPFSSVDKGVDVGAGLSTGVMGTVLSHESATGLITTGGPYDLMSVVVAFGLTDQTGVGFSGYVQQSFGQASIPVPAAVWLFGSGVVGLIVVARRNKTT
jgi:hypothetical protein